MIEELRIEHLGVIAAASVRPGPGFTALGGRFGSGGIGGRGFSSRGRRSSRRCTGCDQPGQQHDNDE